MGSLNKNPLAWASCLKDELTRLQKVSLDVQEQSDESDGTDDNNENESIIGKLKSTYSKSAKQKLSKDLGYTLLSC